MDQLTRMEKKLDVALEQLTRHDETINNEDTGLMTRMKNIEKENESSRERRWKLAGGLGALSIAGGHIGGKLQSIIEKVLG